MRVCFATHNENKLKEIQQLLPSTIELIGLTDLGVDQDIPETGETLEENSLQKASFIFNKFHIPVFADDTGLEVPSLGNAPGVYSARYAGDQRNNEDNMNLLLKNLSNYKDRSARFKTVITYYDSTGHSIQFEGIINGNIIHDKRGERGFGYDPLFEPLGSDRTFAEMDSSEKNEISHRACAFNKLVNYLAAP